MLEKTLESPLDKEIQPVHPKGNQSWTFTGRTDAEAETPILWPPDVKNGLTGKDPDAGRDWRREEKGMTEDEMVGWHHQLNGPPGVGDGLGNLACYNPLGCKESDMTDWLNWTEALQTSLVVLVVKNSPVNAGRYNRPWFDPWIGKIPKGRHGYPLQYS